MNVRVRGIYATALTDRLRDDHTVVRASEPIRDRFEEAFPVAPEDATVATSDDRQGVSVTGEPDAVATVTDRLRLSRDTFAWAAAAPAGGVFDGVVTETLGSGAIVDLGASEGFLPYGNAEDYVETGDACRVQVTRSTAPWARDRPELDTALTVDGGLVELRSGTSGCGTSEAARLAALLPVETPAGWTPRWHPAADEAGMDALGEALERASERAVELGDALAAADPDTAPGLVFAPLDTRWVWFGREGRFELDALRRQVTTTMPGHHRTKAADGRASAAVDFAEAVCDPEGEFPFAAVTRQFGPREGDRIAIGHGKPDGRLITLGRGAVTDYDPAGSITVEREMSPGGTYDALGVERRAGDVAVTRFAEDRWWYATTYRGAEGERRGTYVNVCTPLELFPGMVRYVDLHVDVVKHTDGTVERVDDDELDAAVEAGHVTPALAEKARAVASKIEKAL
jgi:hypothetical protein